MKDLIFWVILNLIGLNLYSQINIEGDYNVRFLKFIGYKNDKPVFFNYSKKYLKEDNNQLYTLSTENSVVKLKLLSQNSIDKGRLFFTYNDNEIYRQFENSYKLLIQNNSNDTLIDLLMAGSFSYNYDFTSNKMFLFVSGFSEDFHIRTVDFSEKKVSVYTLPLLGFTPKILDQYLYFDYHHIDKNKVTPCPVDLYRVKIGDWNNPELLVEFISDSWLPLNDSIVLMILPIKGRGKQVLYNINNKTYIETEKIPTKLIKYQDKEYLLATDRDSEGNKKYILKPLPKIPRKGYVKDNQREILPRVLQVNLPNHQKQFPNTFITDELLYEASETELNNLTKEELRKLRNAFYARRGYKFKSSDLKEFFSQFEWYNQLLESNKFFEIPNEDVVISLKDKERVELILEIENNK